MITPDAPDPWTCTSHTLAYENDWVQVFHDEVLQPDGRPGFYGVIHPRTCAVGVVAIDDRDHVLLVGQYRYTLGRYSWEIPEGGVPIGQDPLEGARRELAEETGVRAAHVARDHPVLARQLRVRRDGSPLYLATGPHDG